jgi:hypothetical protein
MGNSQTPTVRHTIRNCVSWGNKNQGFYANHSPGGTNWYNNTSYKNGGAQFDMLSDEVLSGSLVHVLRNNISFPKKINNPGASDMKNNTWDLDITPANTDFLSVSDSGWTGSRKPDGSLPDIAFLKLKTGSAMIDKGVDLGLPFTGKAPDLGAYEFGAATVIRARQPNAETAPALFTWSESDAREIVMVDPSGRRLQAGIIGHTFRPIVFYTRQAGTGGAVTTRFEYSIPGRK